MSANYVLVCGRVSDYGPKIAWTAQHLKPQMSFTLIVEEPGRDGATYKTFIPVTIVGARAEALCETLDGGDLVLIAGGRLSWKAGRTKDAGKLVVVGFDVQILQKAATPAAVPA